jgi:hypothetical protein
MKHGQTILFKITSCYITLPLKITFYAKTENKILTFSVLLQAEMNLAASQQIHQWKIKPFILNLVHPVRVYDNLHHIRSTDLLISFIVISANVCRLQLYKVGLFWIKNIQIFNLESIYLHETTLVLLVIGWSSKMNAIIYNRTVWKGKIC